MIIAERRCFLHSFEHRRAAVLVDIGLLLISVRLITDAGGLQRNVGFFSLQIVYISSVINSLSYFVLFFTDGCANNSLFSFFFILLPASLFPPFV